MEDGFYFFPPSPLHFPSQSFADVVDDREKPITGTAILFLRPKSGNPKQSGPLREFHLEKVIQKDSQMEYL